LKIISVIFFINIKTDTNQNTIIDFNYKKKNMKNNKNEWEKIQFHHHNNYNTENTFLKKKGEKL